MLHDTQFVLEFDQFIEYRSQDARNPAMFKVRAGYHGKQ